MKKLLWKIGRFFDPSQPVYYSKETKQFFHIKFAQDNGILCGGFATYYSDAKSNVGRQLLSYDYIWNSTPVNAVDKFPYATLCPLVKSWKIAS